MNLHEDWGHNVTLYYIEYDEQDENDKPISYELSFKFYDKEYMMWVKETNLQTDNNFFEMEGPSALFKSLEDLLEDELWPKVKEVAERYKVWLATPPAPIDWTKNKLIKWKETFPCNDDDPDETIEIERKRLEPIEYVLQEGEYLGDSSEIS